MSDKLRLISIRGITNLGFLLNKKTSHFLTAVETEFLLHLKYKQDKKRTKMILVMRKDMRNKFVF